MRELMQSNGWQAATVVRGLCGGASADAVGCTCGGYMMGRETFFSPCGRDEGEEAGLGLGLSALASLCLGCFDSGINFLEAECGWW